MWELSEIFRMFSIDVIMCDYYFYYYMWENSVDRVCLERYMIEMIVGYGMVRRIGDMCIIWDIFWCSWSFFSIDYLNSFKKII